MFLFFFAGGISLTGFSVLKSFIVSFFVLLLIFFLLLFSISVSMYVNMIADMYVYMCMCVNVYVYICVCICLNICVYVYERHGFLRACTNMLLIFPSVREISIKPAFSMHCKALEFSLQTAFHQNTIFLFLHLKFTSFFSDYTETIFCLAPC